MAYWRGGDYYLWKSGAGDRHHTRLHLWVRDGYDGWDLSQWACEDSGTDEVRRQEGFEEASGTGLPLTVMDAFLMIRLAEIIREGLVDEAIDEALRRDGGSVGSLLLEKNADTPKAALKQIQLEEPNPHG